MSLPALQPCEAAAKLRTSLALQDTPVASGSVHSPWKQQVGSRLARGALSVAYGMPEVAKVNPTATSAKLSGTAITVELTGLGANGVITGCCEAELRASLPYEAQSTSKFADG